MDFIHTDNNGFPIKCGKCLQLIKEKPAVKISNSFTEKMSDGPWPASWSISYTYYCENCATEILVERRGLRWPKFLTRLVFGVFLKNKR
jgi:hypothetical protein